jgi:dihydrofolate reductase
MVISANGIIARENGEEDFLSHENWLEFLRLANKSKSFVWGRKTYEAVKTWDKRYFNELAKFKKVILSHNQFLKLDTGFTLANSPQQVIDILTKEDYEEVIITGGSTNNSAFMKAGLVDEVILNIEPTILGKGILLFKPDDFEYRLNLIEIKQLKDEIIQLRYSVKK